MTNIQFFYCYTKKMSDYFYDNGIKPITVAINPASMKKFSLYIKTEQLKALITTYEKEEGR